MSGHSKWAKIKREKAGNDAKRGQIFTKLGNAIAIAARHGADPCMNPALALALEKAKLANMPHTNIEEAIARGSGAESGAQMMEMLFEGYGPGGIGIIVETISDNRNRTTSEVKNAFSKHGGNIAESGAVAYLFERKGVINVEPTADADTLLLAAIDAGAEDVSTAEGETLIFTELRQLHQVRQKLIDQGIKVLDAEAQFVPKTLVSITDQETATRIIKLMDALEEVEDVSATYTNFDIDDQLMAKLNQT